MTNHPLQTSDTTKCRSRNFLHWPPLICGQFCTFAGASKKHREKLSAATAELAKSTPTPDNDAFKPKKQPRRKLQEKFVQSPIDVSFSNLRKT
jgi:hypothetical protein